MGRIAWTFLIILLPTSLFAQIDFTPTVVAPFFDGALNVCSGDLDNDGDLELIGAAESADYFAWWDFDGAQWNEHQLLPMMNGPTNVNVADMDGDGDLDILGAAYLDSVIIWTNDGNAVFTPFTISSHFGIKGIAAWDVDDDGNMDLFVADESNGATGGLFWLESMGVGVQFWPEHMIYNEEGMSNLDIADIDADGDMDIASCGRFNGYVAWWENQGPNSWLMHLVSDNFGDTRSVKIVDMNNDDNLDLVATSRFGVIAWWEQAQPDWIQHDITTTFDGADDVDPADIDGDGDMDIAAVAVNTDEVAWFEQSPGGWVQHTIDVTLDYASGVHAIDIDNDGDVDILGCGYYSDQLVLYRSEGVPLISLTLSPFQTEFPVGGGTLVYDARLVSRLSYTFERVFYWSMVRLPDQSMFGPTFSQQFTIDPFMDITVTLSQYVPANAAPGVYTFYGYVGYYANPSTWIIDSFEITKLGGVEGGSVLDPNEWLNTEIAFDESASANDAIAESISAIVSPNPFNAAAKVSIQLPHADRVRLHVVNLLGQNVAEVFSGELNAGFHSFTIDGSELSSGIYFLTGTIGNQTISTKMVVLK